MATTILRLGLWILIIVLALYVIHESFEDSAVAEFVPTSMMQKALILGQQDNAKGMSDAFRQLLKEFPKSSVAAQANYYIGKAAFDSHACLFGRKRFQDGMQRGFGILHHQHARCAKSHNAVADFGAD